MTNNSVQNYTIFLTKVKSSSKLHVAKIEELEGKLSRQVEMLGEVADKVRKNNPCTQQDCTKNVI